MGVMWDMWDMCYWRDREIPLRATKGSEAFLAGSAKVRCPSVRLSVCLSVCLYRVDLHNYREFEAKN